MPYLLTIDGVLMDRRGAWFHNTSLIRLSSVATRGDNTLIPGIDGTIANPYRYTQLVCDLELLVQGQVDENGTPFADEIEGKFSNLDYLAANVAAPPATPTVVAFLEKPNGSLWTADVQVRNWVVARDEGATAIVTYDLVIPAGVLTAVGS